MDYIDIVYQVIEKWYTGFAKATPRLVVGVLVFVIFLLTSSFLSKSTVKVYHKFFPKSKNKSVVTLIKVFKFLIILSGAFIAFEIMGLGGFIMKFIGSLGVAGVVAGVALKDLVSSMFSGALIGVDKSFAVGDYVTIKDVSGTVQSIDFLTTKVITDEGKKVHIPNQLIFSAPFTNYSASGQRKVFLDEQNADLERALEDLRKAIDRMDVRPRKGFVKVRLRDRASTELTLDLTTGTVLHVGRRGDVFLEKLHSGESLGDNWVLLSDAGAIALLVTLVSGYWLWLAPKRGSRAPRRDTDAVRGGTS